MKESTTRVISPVQVQRGPSAESVLRWMDRMESCEQLVLAGLRRKIGPEGDMDRADAEKYAQQTADRDKEIAHRLSQARRLRPVHGD